MIGCRTVVASLAVVCCSLSACSSEPATASSPFNPKADSGTDATVPEGSVDGPMADVTQDTAEAASDTAVDAIDDEPGGDGPEEAGDEPVPDAAPTIPTVVSSTRGWADIGGTRPGYEYGPAIVLENGTYYSFYCSSPTVTGWDTIRLAKSQNGLTWTAPTDALVPGGAYDLDSGCDPTVVKFRGVYLMYYTCINTTQSVPDGYNNNRVCLAAADKIDGPYHKYAKPVVQDLNCPSDWNASYCVGQPSAVVVGSQIYLYYSNAYPNDPGPGPGKIFLATSGDGLTFLPANGGAAVWDHRDIDVKRDRSSGLFFMVQGEVDTKTIVWTASFDGISWLPYDASRSVASNTDMPGDGQNHNPGLAGDGLGSFDGMTYVVYGSSYKSGWGAWHLYRSDILVGSPQNDCTGCVENSCDWGCSAGLGTEATGHCAVPGSQSQANCCSCEAVPAASDCSACAPQGCVAACRAAGHSIGFCGNPGSTDPAACCSCD